jgi:hypothetical protein
MEHWLLATSDNINPNNTIKILLRIISATPPAAKVGKPNMSGI